MVGTFADSAAGRVFINSARLARSSVVAQHGIEVATAYEHAQPRFAKHGKSLRPAPLGLAEERHFIAVRLQQAADQCRGKGRMVNVSVAADKQKIRLLPAARGNFCGRNRQKLVHGFSPFI